MIDISSIIKGTVETEKAFAQQEFWKYTFSVDPRAEKVEIWKAVEILYWVNVTWVNTVPVRKKERIIWRWKVFTKRDAGKHAVVTIKRWEKIDFTSFSKTKKKEEKDKK